MESKLAANIFIISCLVLPAIVLIRRNFIERRKFMRKNQQTIEDAWAATITREHWKDVQVLKDTVKLGELDGTSTKPFEVYRVAHVPPDRWFAYTHVQGADPVLTPISERRAVAAVGG